MQTFFNKTKTRKLKGKNKSNKFNKQIQKTFAPEMKEGKWGVKKRVLKKEIRARAREEERKTRKPGKKFKIRRREGRGEERDLGWLEKGIEEQKRGDYEQKRKMEIRKPLRIFWRQEIRRRGKGGRKLGRRSSKEWRKFRWGC